MHAVVGVLSDDADPMVTVMKLEKAPQESYADIGGLDQQIQEIKVIVHYNFDHTIVWLVLCLFNFFFSIFVEKVAENLKIDKLFINKLIMNMNMCK